MADLVPDRASAPPGPGGRQMSEPSDRPGRVQAFGAGRVGVAAVARGAPTAAVNNIDGKIVDPVFEAMHSALFAVSGQHGADALRDVADAHTTTRRVAALDIVILFVAIALIGAAGVSLTRSQK